MDAATAMNFWVEIRDLLLAGDAEYRAVSAIYADWLEQQPARRPAVAGRRRQDAEDLRRDGEWGLSGLLLAAGLDLPRIWPPMLDQVGRSGHPYGAALGELNLVEGAGPIRLTPNPGGCCWQAVCSTRHAHMHVARATLFDAWANVCVLIREVRPAEVVRQTWTEQRT